MCHFMIKSTGNFFNKLLICLFLSTGRPLEAVFLRFGVEARMEITCESQPTIFLKNRGSPTSSLKRSVRNTHMKTKVSDLLMRQVVMCITADFVIKYLRWDIIRHQHHSPLPHPFFPPTLESEDALATYRAAVFKFYLISDFGLKFKLALSFLVGNIL